MGVEERVMIITLIQAVENNPDIAEELGICVINEDNEKKSKGVVIYE